MIVRSATTIFRNFSDKWETRLTHQMRLDLGCEVIHLQGGMGE
jgi:hypothetical protein